jgi:hypothetical protein
MSKEPGAMPDTALSDAAVAAEFDMLMARAGIVVPQALRASILVAYADMRGQLALLHAPLSHTAEPAHVFRVAAP